MRGNLPRCGLDIPVIRSIPACAGEPAITRRPTSSGRGLSPRVRGNLGHSLQEEDKWGSIPACAGEPPSPSFLKMRSTVYPRVCGGTIAVVILWHWLRGLSPRVRGNLIRQSSQVASARSIPACAGEPKYQGLQYQTGRVYPRVCGGTLSIKKVVSCRLGLSPRVRGNQGLALDCPPLPRSIPACAGEPIFLGYVLLPRGVYPRVCGGTVIPEATIGFQQGLSPRVRGNRVATLGSIIEKRSIPACAGEPAR